MAQILIVDDDSVTRLTLGALLKGQGHEVQDAPDGAVAIELYSERRFDLCFVDLVMPVKDGIQTITELKELDPDARIIAMTGVKPEKLDAAMDAGAMLVLTKPILPSELKAAVRRGLEHKNA
jgi:two-component system chemotaxis response regulator CheY